MFASVPTQLMEKELNNLSPDDQNNEAQLLKDIIFKASSHDINVQLEGIKEVKNAVSREFNPAIDHLVALGIIPILVECLKRGNEELALETTSTLAIIASGSSEWAEKIVAAKAVPELIELLSSPSESLREWVLRILGHMLDARNKSSDECLWQRVLDYVLKLVTPAASSSFIECVSLFVVNSWKLRHNTPSMESLEKVLSVLLSLLTIEDLDILFHSISMISSLSALGKSFIKRVIESGVMRQLVPFLSHDEDKIKTIVVHALANIASGTDEQTQAVLDEKVLKYFPEILLSSNENIVTHALWFLSNIGSGNVQQIQAVIDAGLIPSIVNALDNGSDGNQREGALAVANISQNGSTEQIMFLVDNGVIPPLCHLLTLTNNIILTATLVTMKNIIKSSGDRQMSIVQDIRRCRGLASLQLLKAHSDEEIYHRVSEILEELLSKEEEKGKEEPMNVQNC